MCVCGVRVRVRVCVCACMRARARARSCVLHIMASADDTFTQCLSFASILQGAESGQLGELTFKTYLFTIVCPLTVH